MFRTADMGHGAHIHDRAQQTAQNKRVVLIFAVR